MLSKVWMSCLLVSLLAGCSEDMRSQRWNPNQIRTLPDVASVEVNGPVDSNLLVLHVLDYKAWNFGESQLSERSIQQLEGLQQEQKAVLRGIIRDLNVKAVGLGGVADGEQTAFQTQAEQFQQTLAKLREGAKQIYQCEKAISQAKILGPSAADGMLSVHHALQQAQEQLTFESRVQSLKLGAVASLIDGSQDFQLIPLEDATIYRDAVVHPFQSGRHASTVVSESRNEAIAQRILTSNAEAIIILVDGSVDLRQSLPEHVAYWRIATSQYQAISSR